MAEYHELIPTVRLLSADNGTVPLLTDDDVSALLTLYGGDTRRAAARALRTIAASEALVSKKIRTQDLSTDGPAVAAALMQMADVLDAEADSLAAAEDAGWFEYISGASAHPEGTEWSL